MSAEGTGSPWDEEAFWKEMTVQNCGYTWRFKINKMVDSMLNLLYHIKFYFFT